MRKSGERVKRHGAELEEIREDVNVVAGAVAVMAVEAVEVKRAIGRLAARIEALEGKARVKRGRTAGREGVKRGRTR